MRSTHWICGWQGLSHSPEAHSNFRPSKLLCDMDLSGPSLGTVSLPSCWLSDASAPAHGVQMKYSQVQHLLCEALLCFPLPFCWRWGSTLGLPDSRHALLWRYTWTLLGFHFSYEPPLPAAAPHTCLCWLPMRCSKCSLTLISRRRLLPLQDNVPLRSVTQFSVSIH